MSADGIARRSFRPLALIAVWLMAAAGAVVAGLAAGAFLDPAGSLFAVVATMVWAPFGPQLLLAALAVVAAGAVAWRSGLRRTGGIAVALGVAGAAGAAFMLMRLAGAALAAGASIDVAQALFTAPMDQPAPDATEPYRTVEGRGLGMAIYRPQGGGPPAPVLLYIHGGGFMTGTNTETAADLRWFADRGWLVLSPEYRLFGPDDPTWDKAPADAACALVWAYGNAERLGGDPRRIVLLGDSAGGNLAINTGFAAAAGRAADCGPEVPVPVAIAVQYPAVDPLSIHRDGYPIPGFEPEMLIRGYIGGDPAEHPGRIAAISSASFLTESPPPTLVILPEKDSLVVAAGTEGFVRAANDRGAGIELVRLPFANHIYNQMAAGSLGNQIGRTIREGFLRRHVD